MRIKSMTDFYRVPCFRMYFYISKYGLNIAYTSKILHFMLVNYLLALLHIICTLFSLCFHFVFTLFVIILISFSLVVVVIVIYVFIICSCSYFLPFFRTIQSHL